MAFVSSRHDHRACMTQALTRAETLCRERGLRLTPIRRRVLELIWRSHQPSRAYELLAAISRERDAATAPPTVYRALDFLLEHGLIHRIESLNAFVGCSEGHAHGHPKFLICNACKQVVEMPAPAVDRAISRAVEQMGFVPGEETVEICGTCKRCRKTGPGTTH